MGVKIKVGEKFSTKTSGTCEVVEYIDRKNVFVKFSDGNIVKCASGSLHKGSVRNPNILVRVGEVYHTNSCGDAEVVEYKGADNVVVKFSDGTLQKCAAAALRIGTVRNPSTRAQVGQVFTTKQSGLCTLIDNSDKNRVVVRFGDGSTKTVELSNLLKGHVFNANMGFDWRQCHRLEQQEAISQLEDTHGDTYDYKLVRYTAGKDKIEIICKIHGGFMQRYSLHKSGAGCPNCATYGIEPYARSRVYILLDSQNVVKVGMTGQDLTRRIMQINTTAGKDFQEVYSKEFSRQRTADVEKDLHKRLKAMKFKQPKSQSGGYTESFVGVPLSIIIGMLEEYEETKGSNTGCTTSTMGLQ